MSGLPMIVDAAFVGGDGAAGNAEQRALAGAVLAEHGVDFARRGIRNRPG